MYMAKKTARVVSIGVPSKGAGGANPAGVVIAGQLAGGEEGTGRVDVAAVAVGLKPAAGAALRGRPR